MTRGGDGNRGSVSNGNMTINMVWRKRVKDTGVLGEVGDGAAVKDPLRGGRGSPCLRRCRQRNIEGGVTGVRKIRVGDNVAGVGRRCVTGGVASMEKSCVGVA
jgi:hypothetical protein